MCTLDNHSSAYVPTIHAGYFIETQAMQRVPLADHVISWSVVYMRLSGVTLCDKTFLLLPLIYYTRVQRNQVCVCPCSGIVVLFSLCLGVFIVRLREDPAFPEAQGQEPTLRGSLGLFSFNLDCASVESYCCVFNRRFAASSDLASILPVAHGQACLTL